MSDNGATPQKRSYAPVDEYRMCGVAVQKSPEGHAIVQLLQDEPGVEVVEEDTFFDIRGPGKLVIDFEELSDILGKDVTGTDIQVEFATIYGRIVATEEALVLFSDFEEAMEFMAQQGGGG
jgi:hypothetical protein